MPLYLVCRERSPAAYHCACSLVFVFILISRIAYTAQMKFRHPIIVKRCEIYGTPSSDTWAQDPVPIIRPQLILWQIWLSEPIRTYKNGRADLYTNVKVWSIYLKYKSDVPLDLAGILAKHLCMILQVACFLLYECHSLCQGHFHKESIADSNTNHSWIWTGIKTFDWVKSQVVKCVR